jgi:hypothetical protein
MAGLFGKAVYIRELEHFIPLPASMVVFGGMLARELVNAGWSQEEAFDVAVHEIAKMRLLQIAESLRAES